DGEVQLVDGLFGRDVGDDGHGGHAVAVGGEHLGRHDVIGPHKPAAQLVVGHVGHLQAHGGIDDREVDAEVGQALVHEAGSQRGGAVDGGVGGAPPVAAGHAPPVALRLV